MCEDELFKRLKQRPLDEVYEVYMHWFINDLEAWTLTKADAVLEPYGWTFIEMYNAKCGEDPPDEWLESR